MSEDAGFDEWWARKLENAAYQKIRSDVAERRARDRRWLANGKSKVIHPAYGTVVVPHESPLSAMLCAAEFWRVPEWPFIREARCVVATDADGPVRRPREYYNLRPTNVSGAKPEGGKNDKG